MLLSGKNLKKNYSVSTLYFRYKYMSIVNKSDLRKRTITNVVLTDFKRLKSYFA